jgi:hypothetical protein
VNVSQIFLPNGFRGARCFFKHPAPIQSDDSAEQLAGATTLVFDMMALGPSTVKTQEPFKVEFHSEAAARFTELALKLLKSISSFGSIERPATGGAEIHPVGHIMADQVTEIAVVECSFNSLGEEAGRYWMSNGLRVGWEGREFDAIKDLVLRFGNARPIKGRVSNSFLLEEVFKWLKQTLEAKRSDTLPEYIAERCSSEINDYEIWVPVYRTYSASEFNMGDVEFRTISRALLDQWYAHVPEEDAKKPEIARGEINRKRARIQGSIAACIRMQSIWKSLLSMSLTHRSYNERLHGF